MNVETVLRDKMHRMARAAQLILSVRENASFALEGQAGEALDLAVNILLGKVEPNLYGKK